jgi:hypothetical protein
MDKLFEGNEAGVEDVLQQVPMGRLGQAEEVARVVGFLLSSEASYVTVRTLSLLSRSGVVLTMERNRERSFPSTEDGLLKRVAFEGAVTPSVNIGSIRMWLVSLVAFQSEGSSSLNRKKRANAERKK